MASSRVGMNEPVLVIKLSVLDGIETTISAIERAATVAGTRIQYI